ncbi:2273_t:CDS:2 [Dentiscutata heterogama]|uniref:2273_t:CDS:1 n=1 Tax=Dentiscutata heterogama TaxID=1316150 RepID=A0ACA9L543_9GLOM|nr:2273_t:CDS:2 [Dentiscutata heterogama]
MGTTMKDCNYDLLRVVFVLSFESIKLIVTLWKQCGLYETNPNTVQMNAAFCVDNNATKFKVS